MVATFLSRQPHKSQKSPEKPQEHRHFRGRNNFGSINGIFVPINFGQKGENVMRKNISASYVKKLLIVACASAGSFTFLPRVLAADPDVPAANQADQNAHQQANEQNLQGVRLPDGFEQKDVSADSGVKSTLVGLTDRAVSKDSYNSFFSSFLAE